MNKDPATLFARCLRQALAVKKLTNKQLASMAHTCEATVSRWVNGKQTPGRGRRAGLEQLLGLDPGTLESRATVSTLVVGRRRSGSTAATLSRQKDCLPAAELLVESPDQVILEFNRWLELYISSGELCRPVDAAEWMHRMWRASTVDTALIDASGGRTMSAELQRVRT